MKQWKTIVTVAIFAALVAFWPGAPANAQTLEFHQLDFDLDGTITLNSDWGEVDLTFTGSTDILYFNLTIDGSWQVENIPVLSLKGSGITQSQRFWFDLKNDVGTDVTSLDYAYELTTTPLGSAPSGSTPASVGDDQIVIYNGGKDVALHTVPPPAEALVGGAVADPVQHTKLNFPNQDRGFNECAPAAVSNSLQFLNAKHGLGMNPNKLTIGEMKKATNWDPGGCWIWHDNNRPPGQRNAWWEDKDAYMKANGYPITTRRFLPADIGKIAAEIDACQDIEVELNGHTAAVVGIADLGGGRHSVTIAHDRKAGVAGGTVEETGVWNGNRWTGALAGYGLNYFVVECPTPKPPGNNFGLFPTDTLPPEGTEEPIYVVEYQPPSPDSGDWHDNNYNGILDSCDYIKVRWVRPSEDSGRYDWLHIVGEHIVNLDRIVDDDGYGIWTPCDSVYKHFKTPPYACYTYRYHVERVGRWRGLWVVKQEFDPRIVTAIPTLTEWGLIIFGVVLLGFITYVFLRRRKAVVSYQ